MPNSLPDSRMCRVCECFSQLHILKINIWEGGTPCRPLGGQVLHVTISGLGSEPETCFCDLALCLLYTISC